MYETSFEDENGKILLETKDGKDDVVVTVSKQNEEAFKAAVNRAFETNTDVNTVEWSTNWTQHLKSGLLGATYNSLGKEFAQNAYLDYLNTPTTSNWLTSIGAAVLSRWLNPEILAGNLAGGIAALEAMPMAAARGGAKAAKGSTSAARLSSNGAKLNQHLTQLEKYGSGGFKTLQNGRFRYYGKATLNRGDANSFRMVREWNPATGGKRTWFETLNPNGGVIQVRPEFGTGVKTHYLFNGSGGYLGKW